MPNPLISVACADTFPTTDVAGAAIIRDVFRGDGGSFSIAGQSVSYKLQFGNLGEDSWTDEQALGVGGGVIPSGATGVAFRNLVAGQIAAVSAFIVPRGQPKLSLAFAGVAPGVATNITATTLANFPPANAKDGDICILVLPASFDPIGGKSIRWILQFDNTNSVWTFLGGPPLYNEQVTAENLTGNGAYQAPVNVCSLTMPRPGLYEVENAGGITASNTSFAYTISYTNGGTAPADADGIGNLSLNGVSVTNGVRVKEKTVANANDVLAQRAKGTGAGAYSIFSRYMRATPVTLT